jgi:hypothetical protein
LNAGLTIGIVHTGQQARHGGAASATSRSRATTPPVLSSGAVKSPADTGCERVIDGRMAEGALYAHRFDGPVRVGKDSDADDGVQLKLAGLHQMVERRYNQTLG